MQHDHPPDYKHWDLLDHFTVAQVACLWCEIKPSGSHLFMRLQHPEIIAIEQFIENAIRGGKLTASTKHAFVSIGDYSKAIVGRSDLKALAEEKGKRPPFLFPEDRHELPPKTANPAKGQYVYNKTTKRIEFRSPVNAESLAAGAVDTGAAVEGPAKPFASTETGAGSDADEGTAEISRRAQRTEEKRQLYETWKQEAGTIKEEDMRAKPPRKRRKSELASAIAKRRGKEENPESILRRLNDLFRNWGDYPAE